MAWPFRWFGYPARGDSSNDCPPGGNSRFTPVRVLATNEAVRFRFTGARVPVSMRPIPPHSQGSGRTWISPLVVSWTCPGESENVMAVRASAADVTSAGIAIASGRAGGLRSELPGVPIPLAMPLDDGVIHALVPGFPCNRPASVASPRGWRRNQAVSCRYAPKPLEIREVGHVPPVRGRPPASGFARLFENESRLIRTRNPKEKQP